VTLPDWPLMLKRAMAAAYLDMSEASFEREIAQGRLPDGVMLGGRAHWYRPALDKAIALIAGEGEHDPEAEFWERFGDKAA